MPWRRGVRARLAAVLVALVALTAVVLGVGASVVADVRLHAEALEDAAAQARFDLSQTIPGRQLPAQPSAEDIDRSGLADTLRLRGVETVVDLPGERFVSREDLSGIRDGLPPDVLERIDAGEIAYAWSSGPSGAVLVVGGRASGAAPDGPVFFFVHDVSTITDAVDQLRLVLALGGAALVVVAFLAARRVARGVLAPVQAASLAAERIAAGDLSARIAAPTHDEFGAMAATFDRMAAALERSQEQNRRFVADVAHELRTPLTALVAEASIVGAHLDDLPPESRRAAELLVADVRRLRTLVEELMELSRFDAGAEQVALVDVDVRRLIDAVVAARLPGAVVDAPAGGPLVVGSDPRRLERVIGNLLDNAREHAGGTGVRVSVERDHQGLSIAVADRGPGVPADRQDRIFQRFSKLDPSRRGGSSGLGLAIAAEHAALLGGSLRASARDGGGLIMTLRLPADPVTDPLPDGDGAVISARDAGHRSHPPQESRS